ncbi:BCCT family transporter [Thorsellia anophelis]|uniref:Choline/glycine/proline betaine transport protein n=1 Tax=Thorsellia anophelis DSM 18579 TaxID=1123402 RepID=A0A1I0BD31_9GAMM|nr:choline BCCT transporter BetT [Thorsellia anophelis]SET04055.1 choline/glycine/proline betaine transport protein [Thorsellia anophelis DSM 18579]
MTVIDSQFTRLYRSFIGYFNLNPFIFITANLSIITLVLSSIFYQSTLQRVFGKIQNWVLNDAGWFYVFSVAAILLSVIILAVSRLGEIKLGLDHDSPDYTKTTWFAMLFSTGMGIGLMFFGVAEPLIHFMTPPIGEGSNVQAAKEAMKITFFHWGLHAWAIYAIVGIILAFFSFRHNLPLSLRSALYPFIKDRIYGPIGDCVDLFALVGTLFGIATSLGFGVAQINSGLNFLFNLPETEWVQIILIIIAMGLATISVTTGLDKGIKFLSQANLILAVILMVAVLIAGPTTFLFKTFLQNSGAYLSEIVDKTFNMYAYEPNDWIGGWTLFYWGWWLSWSPFVGLFIARISKGRTIREFVFGVLFIPTGFTFLWMTIFGNSAIDLVLNQGADTLAQLATDNAPVALFAFFDYLPASTLFSILALVMVIVFFVTSADSGALVIDMLASGKKSHSPAVQRAYWSILIGIVAIALLATGGLQAMQAVTIASAFPFTLILLISIMGLFKALKVDATKQALRYQMLNTASSGNETRLSWQKRMRTLTTFARRSHVERFLDEVVEPAFELVCDEWKKQGIQTVITRGEEKSIKLEVQHGSEMDFIYEIVPNAYIKPDFAQDSAEQGDNAKYFRADVYLREGGQNYDVMGWHRDEVISDIIEQYERHLHFLHLLR